METVAVIEKTKTIMVKKSTSDVWQYFEKYLVTETVNGKPEQQLWAKCKYKGCNNKTSKHRAESKFGTTGFWNLIIYLCLCQELSYCCVVCHCLRPKMV